MVYRIFGTLPTQNNIINNNNKNNNGDIGKNLQLTRKALESDLEAIYSKVLETTSRRHHIHKADTFASGSRFQPNPQTHSVLKQLPLAFAQNK
jgi:hypothetical protein